ncbi:MAG: B12-binding domain-containing radical SAM protein [Parcubacteria group bacterium]|nr:B12-binding domain-containing radical SAM protein [Parcubacteria group bacterium]
MKILLVVYDNGSYMHVFPSGLGYIAAVLQKEGYDVDVFSQDKFHWPDQYLTEYLNKNRYDFVGVGVIAGYYQYRKLLKISEAINRSKYRPFYVIGGHGPSPDPEYFLEKTAADAAILGEGELTIIELLEAVANNEPLEKVKGIAFRNGEKTIITEERPLIGNVDSIPFPAFDLFPIPYYSLRRVPHTSYNDFLMDVITGRGCTFTCNFCYRLDEGFRPRNVENIIEEINLLRKRYGITYVAFQDELLMSSKIRTEEICEGFIKANLNIKWNCNGRLNYASPELLRLMKKAGCVFINYGIESMDNQVLKNMKKGLTTKQIIKGISRTIDAGISPGLNIIFGNIGDNRNTLNKGVELLLGYDNGAQLRTIRPVTPYPGSPLYYYAIEKGLLKDCEDFYEKKHTNSDLLTVNFTELSDDEFYECLLEANTRLLENYHQKKLTSSLKQTKNLYNNKDAGFSGFRQI